MRAPANRCPMTSRTELIVTPQAREDVQEIYQYTYARWDIDQAEAYDAMLHSTFLLLREFPEMAPAGEVPGVREHHLKHHTVIYRYDRKENTVTILRIVNPRRRSTPSR